MLGNFSIKTDECIVLLYSFISNKTAGNIYDFQIQC